MQLVAFLHVLSMDKKRGVCLLQDYKLNITHQSVWTISFRSLVREATLNLGIRSSCTFPKAASHKGNTKDKYRQNLGNKYYSSQEIIDIILSSRSNIVKKTLSNVITYLHHNCRYIARAAFSKFSRYTWWSSISNSRYNVRAKTQLLWWFSMDHYCQ